MAVVIQHRRGTAAEWVAENPVLANGELGLETDTGRFKHGDGSLPWNSLPYSEQVQIGPTPPAETHMLWIDTTETPVVQTTDTSMGAVKHGNNSYAARPESLFVYWYGAVPPLNATEGDIWRDSTQ